jgi:archaellum biogenesis protein FlaJ (TadC family)
MICVNKDQFDEMQTQKRNQIGNQSFSLLVWLLLLDTLLYNLGIRWLQYPMNVFMIVMVCCGVFIIRTALDDSLVAPKQKSGKSITLILITTILSMATVAGLGFFIKLHVVPSKGSSVGATLLLVISWGVLIIAAVIYLVRRHRENRRDN